MNRLLFLPLLLLLACQTPSARRELETHWQFIDRFLLWEHQNRPGGDLSELADRIRDTFPALWNTAVHFSKGTAENRVVYESIIVRIRALVAEVAEKWTSYEHSRGTSNSP